MTAACSVEELQPPRRATWLDVASGGRDLALDGQVVARVRPMPGGGWFWHGLGRNSTAGKGARAIDSLELACKAAGDRARELFEGVVFVEPRRGPRPAVLVALDRAQPGLAGVELGRRVDLFCRLHLLGELPEAVTEADVEAVRAALAVFHRTGAWPEELAP